MVGDCIMVCPVLHPDINHYNVYLPKGRWGHFGDQWIVYDSPGEMQPLYANVNMNIMLKGGSIIPFQDSNTF